MIDMGRNVIFVCLSIRGRMTTIVAVHHIREVKWPKNRYFVISCDIKRELMTWTFLKFLNNSHFSFKFRPNFHFSSMNDDYSRRSWQNVVNHLGTTAEYGHRTFSIFSLWNICVDIPYPYIKREPAIWAFRKWPSLSHKQAGAVFSFVEVRVT